MKSRLPILLPLALLVLATLACGGSGSVTPAAAKSQDATQVAAPPSAGLGLDRADWERQHKSSGATAGFQDYDAGAYSILFVGGNVSQIERNYKDIVPALDARRKDAGRLIPTDAKQVRTYHPEAMPELTVDLYGSAWLVDRFPAGPWPNAEPGQFSVIHGPSRTIIALGNSEDIPAPAANSTAPATAAPAASGSTAAKGANLRAGPGTTFKIVGGVKAGDPLQIVGKNKAGDWYQLAGGQWIADFLVTNPPDVPVVEEPASSAPAPTNVPAAARSGVVAAPLAKGPPTAGDSDCACDSNTLNCDDFPASGWEAQACYLHCKELTGRDVHGLDRDSDGDACEWTWSD